LGHYGGSLRTAIHRLKYDGKTGLARPLAHLLSRSMEASSSCLLEPSSRGLPVSFDLVVPVPLHPARLHERGYNQSERIAFYLARERRWPLDTDHLVRVRRTRSQTTLDRAARAANVRGAFAVRDATAFTGKSVLILDDVLTTTATVSEAARALRGAGAARVTVVALAID
jgi:ComF family protein